jgi:hypothetical protein
MYLLHRSMPAGDADAPDTPIEQPMPLTPSAPREPLHTRLIEINGYRRADGLFDIEGRLRDTKPYGFPNQDRGYVAANEPIHDLWMRMTVSETMEIVACEAASDLTPYAVCPKAAPNFAALTGLHIRPGFLREATNRVRGTLGCTHLREMLQQMATTAFQTINPARARRELKGTIPAGSDGFDAKIAEKMGGAPAIVGTCLAYGTDGPVVQRRWPHLYTGPAKQPEIEAAAD